MTDTPSLSSNSSEPNVVLATFLARFVADEEGPGARGLDEYQAMFPGYEDVIAREYASLLDGSDPAPAATTGGLATVGPYRVLHELGRGGQSVVYLAEDPRLRRKVALKVLPASLLASDRAKERFRREAELAAKLDHPGICVVLESGEHDGMPYIAMRFVEGESLAEHIATAQMQSSESEELTYLEFPEGPDAASEAGAALGQAPDRREITRILGLIERIARALHSAHEEGLLHRDIKPGNIMVTPDGEPVILDFGLARDDFRDGKTITGSGDLMGTPAYMSPEQLLAQRIRLDRRSDVYSLGVTAFECLTLTRPFDAPTREGMYQRILTGQVPDPRRLNPAISRDIKVVLETALEKDRQRRYPTALALADDLRRLRTFEPITARAASPALRLRRWARRHPAVATAVVLLFVALGSGLGITWYFKEEAETQALDLEVAVDSERAARSALQGALDDRSRALKRSKALLLVELARQEREVDPLRASALAMRATLDVPDAAIRGALADALEALPLKGRVLGPGAPYAAFTADGKHLLTKGGSALRRYSTTEGEAGAETPVDGLNHRYIAIDDAGEKFALLGEHSAQVLDAKSGDTLAVLRSEDLTLNRAIFSPDGSRLAIVGGSSTVERRAGRVWLIDLSKGEQRVLRDTETNCWGVDFDGSGNRLAIACRGGYVAVLNSDDDGEPVFEHKTGSTLPWPEIRFSPDGGRVFEGTRNGLREWTLATGKSRGLEMEPGKKHFLNGFSCARSLDRRRMLVWAETKVSLGQSMTGNLPAVLWDLEEGRRVRLFPGMVTSAAISGDGRRAAIVRKGRRGADARGEQRILIYDLEEPDEDRSLVDLGEFHRVAWLSLDAQGERLAVMGHDGASLFDITATRAVPRMPDTIYDSRITADGKTMVVHDKTREISFVDLRTLKVTRSIPVTKRPESYVMSTDFRDFDMDAEARFAIAKADITTLRWIDLEAGKTLREFDGDGIRSCLLTGGGTRLLRSHGELSKETVDKVMMDFVMTALVGQSDLKPEDFLALVKESAVELVDLESGKTVAIRSWSGIGLPVRSADGMKVLVPSKNENGRRRAYVIDGKTGKQLFKVTAPTVSGVFSPKSDRLLTMDSRQIGGSYASIGRDDPQILDARTGAVVCTLATGGVGIMDARWSPDGGLIAVACRDGVVRVCEPTGGRVMYELRGHQGKVTGCEFSADGELIVSHSEDGTFRVWEVEAEKEILRVTARSTLGKRGTWKRARFVDGDQGILVLDEKSRPYLFPVDPVARGRLMGIEPIPESDLERLGL